MAKTLFDGRPIFEVANKDELKTAVVAYKGKVEAPYVVQLPDGLTEVEYAAFCNDDTIGVVILPNTIEDIGELSFADCSSLVCVHIPDSVEKIGKQAFENSYITHLDIPASVVEIGDDTGKAVFNSCAVLSKIRVDSENRKYDSRENCNAIIETETDTLLYGCAKTIIPDTVKVIGYGAFNSNKMLEEIIIPKSVVKIEEEVFLGCTSLKTVDLGESLQEIPYSTFSGCTSLSVITIPNSVKKIDDYAFRGCTSLSVITIPDSVKEISLNAFYDCSSLKEVHINNHTLLDKGYINPDVKIMKISDDEID